MADILAAVGDVTSTSAALVVRHDVAGVWTASVTGAGTFLGTCDPLTADGVSKIAITGLSPAQTYAWRLIHSDGSSESGTLTTYGASEFWVGWMYCHVLGGSAWWADVFKRLGCLAVIGLGDLSYTNFRPLSMYGLSYDPLATLSTGPYDVQQFYRLQRMWWMQPLLREMRRHIPFYMIEDDHRCLGDNWDHSVTKANDTVTTWAGVRTPGTPQLDVDDHWWTTAQAISAYYMGNPSSNYAGLTPVKPNAAHASTPASHYVSGGFRVDIGPLRIVVPDLMCSRHPLSATDDSSKIMIGPYQKAQIITDLADDAGFDFGVMALTKNLFTDVNGDSWGHYSTERDDLITSLQAARSGTLISITGDLHHGHDSRAGWYARPLREYAGCPASPGAQWHDYAGYAFEGHTSAWRWKAGGAEGADTPRLGCAAIRVVGDEYIEVHRFDETGNDIVAPARFNAGSSDPVAVQRRVSFV